MKQEVKATAITLDMSTLEVEAGLTGQLTATLEPLNSTDVPTFSSNEALPLLIKLVKLRCRRRYCCYYCLCLRNH